MRDLMIPPDNLLPWLNYRKFLTEKLRSLTGDATLHVLSQKWTAPDGLDCGPLLIKDSSVFHREILMTSHEHSCWYARTILPVSTFNAKAELFQRLEHESLGHIIFSDQSIQRHSLTHCAIFEGSTEYSWLSEGMHQGNTLLWGRVSEFRTHLHPFFLIEIFLPGLLQCIK